VCVPLVAVATDHPGTVGRDEDVFDEHLDVGHTREDALEDLPDSFPARFGKRVVVDVVGRDDFIEARHVVAGHDLGEEVAELDHSS